MYEYYMRNLLQDEFDIILWILKIIIAVLWLIDFYFEYIIIHGNHSKKQHIKDWRNTISFWFSFFIGILLIYLFNPWRKMPITIHTRYTLFVFGIIYTINLNWKVFFYLEKIFLLKVVS